MSKLGNYYVKWNHKSDSTVCSIKKDHDVVALGLATKHPQDRPDHRVARRISFQRAMNELSNAPEISKEDIGNVWKDYLKIVRQPAKVT